MKSHPFWKNWKGMLLLDAALCSLILSAFLLVSGAHAAAQSSPVTWSAVVGNHSSDNSTQDSAIVPGDLWINVGDTVTWKAGNPLDVLTFLPAGTTVEPQFTFAPNQINSTGGSHYDGKSYFSSGLMGTMPSMFGFTFAPQYSLTFDVAGTFTYYNLPSLGASGVIHVQPAGSPYPHTQQFYNLQMQAEQAQMQTVGIALVVKALLLSAQSKQPLVVAGIDQGTISKMRFYPPQITVHVGQVLTFTNYASEPHTVTFGPPPSSLFQAFQPYGNPNGYNGSSPLNSGAIGTNPRGIPSQIISFSMSFSQPGTYPYYCFPHDDLGMIGTVLVVP